MVRRWGTDASHAVVDAARQEHGRYRSSSPCRMGAGRLRLVSEVHASSFSKVLGRELLAVPNALDLAWEGAPVPLPLHLLIKS